MDRLAVQNTLFGSAKHQAHVLEVLSTMKTMSRMFCAQMLQRPGSIGLGQLREMEVVLLLLMRRARLEVM